MVVRPLHYVIMPINANVPIHADPLAEVQTFHRKMQEGGEDAKGTTSVETIAIALSVVVGAAGYIIQ